jgi:hypothetical protein
MADPLIDFLEAEYEYLARREGRDFFLALAPYANALYGRERFREILETLQGEMREALERFVHEQNECVEEARAIRRELAERAPEIDNSDMEQPDPRTHAYTSWDLDSFARFDDLVERDARLQIGYPTLPDDEGDPGIISRLLQILRGRLRAAEYGEEASGLDPPLLRSDLGDLGRRIGNLGERYRASIQRYRQESRTLSGIAFARLVYFGSDLVADPVQIENEEDVEQFLDRSIREWGRPKTIARKLANDERLDDWEQRSIERTEATLKREAEKLTRELVRRLKPRSTLVAFVEEHAAALVVTAVGTVIAGLILFYLFGIGGG